MYKTLVLGFVSLILLSGCSDMSPENKRLLKNIGQAAGSINNSMGQMGSPSTMGTGYLESEYTQGFNKVCVYDRMGSVDTKVISSMSLCPLTI